ncbi:MAG: bacterial Ig-like domain-containing protein [Candidatus Enteromonas sp.]
MNGEATTGEVTKTVDGVNYAISSGAKSQSSSGTNRLSTNPAIFIGKSGTYIYNSTPFETNIAKFELFANSTASKKVSVQVDFDSEPLTAQKAKGDWTQTLSVLDKVYTIDSVPEEAKYFRYSVTNANNSQVQFRITLKEGVANTLTGITAELKDSTKTWNEGETITLDDINVYAVYSVSGSVLVTEGITIENNTLSAGENAVTLSYAGKTCDLAVTAATRIVESVDVVGDMTQKSYSLGSSWNLDGLSLSVPYNTGDPIAVSLDDTRVTYTVNPTKADSTSITSLTISGEFDGVSFTKSIEGIVVHEPYYTLVSDEAKLYPGMKFHITASNGAYAAGTLSNNLLQKS